MLPFVGFVPADAVVEGGVVVVSAQGRITVPPLMVVDVSCQYIPHSTVNLLTFPVSKYITEQLAW